MLLTDDKDTPQYRNLLSNDYIDRVFPSPDIADAYASEAEAWEIRKVHARRLREIFPQCFPFMCWQHYVIDGYTQEKIASLYGVTQKTISIKLNSIKSPPIKRG